MLTANDLHGRVYPIIDKLYVGFAPIYGFEQTVQEFDYYRYTFDSRLEKMRYEHEKILLTQQLVDNAGLILQSTHKDATPKRVSVTLKRLAEPPVYAFNTSTSEKRTFLDIDWTAPFRKPEKVYQFLYKTAICVFTPTSNFSEAVHTLLHEHKLRCALYALVQGGVTADIFNVISIDEYARYITQVRKELRNT